MFRNPLLAVFSSCGRMRRVLAMAVILGMPAPLSAQTEPTLEELLDQLEQAVYKGKSSGTFQPAMAIGSSKDPRSIPILIGLIDSDNSYDTVYGIGWFALNPLTGVRYDPTHHGPWWRKWWAANADRFPADVRDLPIPGFPKTPEGDAFSKNPPDPASIILEPTLDDLLERLVKQVRAGAGPRIVSTAQWIAEFNEPRAIPTLIGLIDSDNSEDTIYCIG